MYCIYVCCVYDVILFVFAIFHLKNHCKWPKALNADLLIKFELELEFIATWGVQPESDYTKKKRIKNPTIRKKRILKYEKKRILQYEKK